MNKDYKNNIGDTLVDKFIESVLKDRPISAFDLEEELVEFFYENQNVDIQNISSKDIMDNSLDEEINNELIQACELTLKSSNGEISDDNLDRDFLLYMQEIEDPLLYKLAHKIIRDNRVRIRVITELDEKELSDEYTSNKWIFHRDGNYKEDLKYILDYYDSLNQEDNFQY